MQGTCVKSRLRKTLEIDLSTCCFLVIQGDVDKIKDQQWKKKIKWKHS